MWQCGLGVQGRVYAPGDSEDKMAAAIKDFNQYVINDDRVEVIAMPFRDGVNIVQRRYSSALYGSVCAPHLWSIPWYTAHVSKQCVKRMTAC